MNFSEKLKESQKKALEEQNLAPQIKVNSIIDGWYNALKQYCMIIAEKGGTTYQDDLYKYIQHLDTIYTEKQINHEDINGSSVEEHFIAYHRDSPEARYWENVRPLFFHYRYGMEYHTDGAIYHYHYPNIYGLEKGIAEQACQYIKDKFKLDGLDVETKNIEWQELYKIEERYFEYSQLEKRFTGKNGCYKKVPVKDIKVYNIYISISW